MRRFSRLLALMLVMLTPLCAAEELIIVDEVSAAPVSTPSADEIAGGREFNDELLDEIEDEEGGFENARKTVHMLDKSLSRFNNILNVSGTPDAGFPIPYVYQFNYDTPFCRIGKRERSVATSGCGAVCMSMVIAYFTENYDQTPYTLMYRAAAEGNYNGNGLSYEVLQEMLESYRVHTALVDATPEAITDAMRAGCPVIIKMGPGTFTKNGHYILLRGLDKDGRVYVTDPNNAFRSTESFEPELIAKECKGAKKQMLVITSERKTKAQIEQEIIAEQEAAMEAEREIARLEEEAKAKAEATPEPTAEATPTADASRSDETSESEDDRSGAYHAPQNSPSPSPSPTIAPTPTPVPTPTPEIIEIRRCNYKSVNLRAEPNKSSRITGTAKKGNRLEVVEITEEQSDGHIWYGVLQGGEVKYIRDDLTDPVG